MIRTRGHKILRDIWARKGRTVLVSLAIFIGVTGTIALFSMSSIIVGQLREDIKEDELAMLSIYTTVTVGDQPTDADNLSYLQALDQVAGVTELMGTANVTGYFKTDPDDEDFEMALINGYDEIREGQLAHISVADAPIEPGRVVEGRYPNPDAHEVAIEQRMAEEFGLDVGDPIYFRVLTSDAEGNIPTEPETWTVSGIVLHAYSESPDVSIYGYVSEANYLAGQTGYSLFLARFTDFDTTEAQQETFTNLISNDTAYIPVFSLPEDPEANQQVQGAQTIGNTMGFLALVALIVSGFLVINVITSIVVEQKRQIGVMKSMGATRMDNIFIYSGMAFMYGLIAVIPGVPLGMLLGDVLSDALAPSLNTVLPSGFNIAEWPIILGIGVGLAIPVLSSLLPVFLGTRVQIREAMTDLGIDAKYGYGPLAKIIKALPVPVTVRQGLSNVSIKKSRLAFTVITLSIAAGAFMGIYFVFDSLTSGIDAYLDTFNVEIFMAPKEGLPPEEIVPILEENFVNVEDPQFSAIEKGFQLQVEFEGYDPSFSAGGPPGIFAYGYEFSSPHPAFNFTLEEGPGLTQDNYQDGIIFSQSLALAMEKEVGDTVILKVPGNTKELTIVGIADFPIDQVWIDWRTLALTSGYVYYPDGADVPQANEYTTTLTASDAEILVWGMDVSAPEMAALGSFFSDGALFEDNSNGIIVSQEVADANGWAVDQTITLTAANGSSADYTITGIFAIPEAMAEQFAQAMGGSIPQMGMDFDNLAALEELNLNPTGDPIPLPQAYLITTTIDDPSVRDVDKVIDDLNEVLLANGIPADSFNFVELVDQLSQIFFTFQAILSAVAGLIALVGALGLLTTLSMSVYERQKEIGVMRSIGAGSGTVAAQFLTEGLVVGFISWLIGLPLAVLIEWLLLKVTEFDAVFPLVWPWESLGGAIIGFVGMIVITTVASLWPSIAASRKTVSDILRYQ
jgi:ABC-type antimicrobial peptide transport system permease subunit